MKSRVRYSFAFVLLYAFLTTGGIAQAAPPKVTLDPVTAIGTTSVHVSGSVNPENAPSGFVSWRVIYTTTPGDPPSQWNQSNVSGFFFSPEVEETTPIAVEGTVEGLTPGREYFMRLAAGNSIDPEVLSTPLVVFDTEPIAPPTVSLSPVSGPVGSSLQLEGSINPGSNDQAATVVWQIRCTPECLDPVDEQAGHSLPPGTAPQAVSAELIDLLPNTTYEARLVANNRGASAETDPITFTTAATGPSVAEQKADPTSSESHLTASLVTGGLRTEYHFEYGLTAAYGERTPQRTAPGEGPATPVEADLVGLAPGVTYHYRLVATNSMGTAVGSDAIFETAPAAAAECPNEAIRVEQRADRLGDCRAWELVSPVDKNGGYIADYPESIVGSESGGAAAFKSQAGFANAHADGGFGFFDYIARRTNSGWETNALTPLTPTGQSQILFGTNFLGFSPDLEKAVLVALEIPGVQGAAPGAGYQNYLEDTTTDALQSINPSTNPEPAPPLSLYPAEAGARAESSDFQHIAFEARVNLTPDAAGPFPKVYEWSGGTLRIASVLPDGSLPPEGASSYPAGGGGVSTYTRNTMSSDGSRLVFTAPIEGVPRLYLRRDAAQTAWVSESEATTPEPPSPAVFREMAANGSKVFFTSSQRLVDAAPAAAGPEELYMYTDGPNPEAERNLTLISVDEEPADGDEAGVLGVLGVSRDGGRVYFAALGRLLPSVPASVRPSEPKIYLWDHGKLSYVGASTATSNWERVHMDEQTGGMNTSRVSDDGGALLYATRQEGALGEGAIGDGVGPTAFHLFTLATGKTVCVSCPGGRSPQLGATLQTEGIRGHVDVRYLPRVLSADGRRVFFSTPEALVPEDTNGVEDAYEYDASDGRLHLISSGRGNNPSFFADANASGSEVFFLTGDRLVARDQDGLQDLYVARSDGGFAESPSASACASETECRGPAGQAAPAAAAGSSAITAATTNTNPHRRKHRRPRKRRHSHRKHRVHHGSRTPRHHHRKGSK